jgi:hypothetical protein
VDGWCNYRYSRCGKHGRWYVTTGIPFVAENVDGV